MAGLPARVQDDIIRAGRRMDQRGWVPATAGNISVRFRDDGADGDGTVGDDAGGDGAVGDDPGFGGVGRIAITRSGGHKGFLDRGSVIEVDFAGRALAAGAKPSAETLLHCQIYRSFPEAGAVLHGHSVAGTVLSLAAPSAKIEFTGYELFKAFAGQRTHDTTLTLPLFANDQDIARLAGVIGPHLPDCKLGYYIRGHGAYVWAHDMDSALARLEAMEFLLECELARRHITAPSLETLR